MSSTSTSSTESSITNKEESLPYIRTLPYYDQLLLEQSKSGNLTRIENLLLLVDDTNLNQSQNQDHDKGGIAICNLVNLLAYSDDTALPGQHDGSSRYELGAATMLAAEHLNTGNGAVVPEVEGLNTRCNIRFTFDLVDSQHQERPGVDRVIELTDMDSTSHRFPCAFLGAERSAVSMPAGIITGLRGFPQISAFSTSPALNNQDQYPLFGRTIPADDATAIPVIHYFNDHLNVKYLGVLYVNDSFGAAFFAGLSAAAQEFAPTMKLVGVEIPYTATQKDVERVVRTLKDTEFRYFFAIVVGRLHDMVMREAYHEGIAGTGEHTWLFSESAIFDVMGQTYSKGDDLYNAFQGTGVISASGGLRAESPSLDRFMTLHQQLVNPVDLDYLMSRGEESGLPGNVTAQDIINTRPVWNQLFSPWSYDAAIAMGLAACNVESSKREQDSGESDGEALHPYFTGHEHFQAFKELNVTGASGQLRFDPDHGSRDPASSYYVLTNFQYEPVVDDEDTIRVGSVNSAIFESGGWRTLTPFIYGDGSLTPHDHLPALEMEDNLLTTGWRVAGLTMCATAMLLAIGFATWTYLKRGARVVRASQPIFLYLVCLGMFLFASSIIPLSFDTGIASQQGCTIACTSVFWQLSIGFSVAFSALFTKTYRVNKIFSSRNFLRVRVTVMDVVKPMLAIVSANILLLSIMTVFAPVEWQTEVINRDDFDREIEFRGFCDWMGSIWYLVPLAVLNLSCLGFAVVQAYGARKISVELQESEYIFMSMVVFAMACFLWFPVLILTQDNSTANYFVLTSAIFVTSSSVLLLIFVPKIRFHQENLKQLRERRNMGTKGTRRSSFINALGSGSVISGLDFNVCHDESGLRVVDHPRSQELLKDRIQELEDTLRSVQPFLPMSARRSVNTKLEDNGDDCMSQKWQLERFKKIQEAVMSDLDSDDSDKDYGNRKDIEESDPRPVLRSIMESTETSSSEVTMYA